MGRNQRSRTTTGEVMRMELRWMQGRGYFRPGEEITSLLSWTDGSTISATARNKEGDISLSLSYTITDRITGEKRSLDYLINLVEVPSNLGRGKILFFICPVTGKRCRILYKAYGSPIFKSREAYSYKIYYELQTSSRLLIHNTRYFNLERRLDKLYRMRGTSTYRGKPTRRALLIDRLEEKLEREDLLRWMAIDTRMKKGLYS